MIYDQNILDKVDELRHTTESSIIDIQNTCSPGLMNTHLENMLFYIFKGVRHPIRFHRIQIYMSKDIPFIYTHSRYEYFISFLISAIEQQKIYPFLLFVGGKVINWSNILVVKDYNYCYLVILDYPDIIREAKIVYIPCNVRYGEDDDIMYSPGLYFDENGLFTTSEMDNISTRLEIIDNNVFVDIFTPTLIEPFFKIPTVKKGQISSLHNIVPFKNGLLYPEGLSNLKNEGYNIYSIIDKSDIENIVYVVFYYLPSNSSSSVLYKNNNNDTSITKILTDSVINNKDVPDFIELLRNNKFDFSMKWKVNFDKNIQSAIEYITSYDQSLLNSIIADNSTIFSESYTGSEFINKSINGYVEISRHRKKYLENYIILFVNGTIYKYYDDIIYENNTIKIPVLSILPSDDIEILFFTDINNNITDITINSNTENIYMTYESDIEDIALYSLEYDINNKIYDIVNQDKYTMFHIPFSYTKINNNIYNISLSDSFYYGKKLFITSSKQFHHYRFRFGIHRYKFELPEEFKFCHNIDRYVVFVNGARIDRDLFTVTIPKLTRPFDRIKVYIASFMTDDDIVDIFYVPTDLIDIIKSDTLNTNGDIIVDLTNLPYTFSKDLFMIFINGIKVNPTNILDLAINKLHIKTDIGSIYNVCIVKYIDIYYEYLLCRDSENNVILDNYSQLIHNMGDDIKYIYNDTVTNISEGRDYKLDYYTLRNLVYDIVYEYYVRRAKVPLGRDFVYDFEHVFDQMENNENGQLIPLLDGLHSDKMVLYRFNTLANWQYNILNLISDWEIQTVGYQDAGYINVFVDDDDNLWFEVSEDSNIKDIYIDENGNLIFEYIKY